MLFIVSRGLEQMEELDCRTFFQFACKLWTKLRCESPKGTKLVASQGRFVACHDSGLPHRTLHHPCRHLCGRPWCHPRRHPSHHRSRCPGGLCPPSNWTSQRSFELSAASLREQAQAPSLSSLCLVPGQNSHGELFCARCKLGQTDMKARC